MAVPEKTTEYDQEKTLDGSSDEKSPITDGTYVPPAHTADGVINESAALQRGLHGRHMQMIAIGLSFLQRLHSYELSHNS